MRKSENSNWPLPRAKPEDVGVSSERMARIRPGLQKYIDNRKVSNFVTLVARHGKIIHYEAQGHQDIKAKKPAQQDSLFRLYSNSKPIAGLATMMCVEDGLLSLTDPVSRYIPAFKNPMILSSVVTQQSRASAPFGALIVPSSREITILDCLRHTTGLATPKRFPAALVPQFKNLIDASGWDMMVELDRVPEISFKEMVEAHAGIPLCFEPGTDFEYHIGYPVLGVVLETVTGKTLEQFYRERIFQPLGMQDTSFYLDKEKIDRFSTCYRPELKKGEWSLGIYDHPETSEKTKGTKKHCGAGGNLGGLLSTAADYARFAQMLLNGGELEGVRIIGRKSVEMMTRNHLGDVSLSIMGPGFGFGVGVGVFKGGAPLNQRSIGTYGWGGAAGTTWFNDPQEDLIAICFTQLYMSMMMPDCNYQAEFERMVYQSLI
jgi:CubicO group peptidase (beta-lactamase class C family)